MPDFKSIKDLNKYLQKQINEIAEKKLVDGVRDYIMESVNEVVYDSYEPTTYIRRGFSPSSTGIGGKSQMKASKVTKDGEFIVTNEASKNPNFSDNKFGYDDSKSLTENIVYGYFDQTAWSNHGSV